MLPCYVCTKEGQKGSNLDKLGELVSSEPWPNGYPLCKDSLWFIFKYRVEKRHKNRSIGLFGGFWLLISCMLQGASSLIVSILNSADFSVIHSRGWHIMLGVFPPRCEWSQPTISSFWVRNPFIFTGISWDPGCTQSTQSFAKLLPILSIYAVGWYLGHEILALLLLIISGW